MRLPVFNFLILKIIKCQLRKRNYLKSLLN